MTNLKVHKKTPFGPWKRLHRPPCGSIKHWHYDNRGHLVFREAQDWAEVTCHNCLRFKPAGGRHTVAKLIKDLANEWRWSTEEGIPYPYGLLQCKLRGALWQGTRWKGGYHLDDRGRRKTFRIVNVLAGPWQDPKGLWIVFERIRDPFLEHQAAQTNVGSTILRLINSVNQHFLNFSENTNYGMDLKVRFFEGGPGATELAEMEQEFSDRYDVRLSKKGGEGVFFCLIPQGL